VIAPIYGLERFFYSFYIRRQRRLGFGAHAGTPLVPSPPSRLKKGEVATTSAVATRPVARSATLAGSTLVFGLES